MRFSMALLCLLLPTSALAVSAEEIVKVAPVRMQRLIAYRQAMLEQACGIETTVVAPPEVTFTVPPDIHPARPDRFGGRFIPATQSYLFNWRFYAALNRWRGDEPDSMAAWLATEEDCRKVVDHEAGHAIVYRLALRSRALNLYGAHKPTDESVGAKILIEGLGTYFERRLTANRTTFGVATMPSRWEDEAWFSNMGHILYEGGVSVVGPIIDEYGEQGILYILANPLVITNGNAAGMAFEYQKKALHALDTTSRRDTSAVH